MPRISLKTFAFATALLALSSISRADWVAFNDHVPGTIGTQTHSNATTLKIPSTTNGPVSSNLLLKNITTGTNLGVTLTITRSGTSVLYVQGGAAPANLTPLFNTFNGFVYFGVAADSNVEITNSTVTYAFTGLNPAKRYSFIGGANRGASASAASNKFTRVEIQGATSFVNAHSSHVITSTQVPALLSNQVVVNFATNTPSGDQIDWENIAPAANGSFSIVCSQYQGTVPNGGKSDGINAYAITGIRLEELPAGPPVISSQPQNQNVGVGQTATFSVTASGQRPLSYQWYRNGSMIPSATNSSYTTPATTWSDYGATFSVTVFNALGSLPSTNAVLTVFAQPVVIMPLTNVWKYDQSGRDLGTAWQVASYDDATWPSGKGVLALETDNQTVIPLTNTVLSLFDPNNVRLVTYYFRSHFNLAYDPTSITLTASNLIDDAAVVYLNGHEVYRQNIVAAPARVTYTTGANAAIEAAWSSFVLPQEFLVQGDNFLAVEVHQGGATSSDIVWGMSVRGDVPAPSILSITNEPADRTVNDGSPTTFSVGYSGSQPVFQWYKWVNDVPVPVAGATKPSFTISNTVPADAGYYFITISNVLNTVVSRSALLNVAADLAGPTLVEADGTIKATNVTVSFSEVVTPVTATNTANYVLTNVTSGGTLTISKAVLVDGTNVVLTSAARVDGANYLLIVNNVRDASIRNNAISPNSSIGVSALVLIAGFNQGGWDYYNPIQGPPDQPFYPGSNWNQLGFSFGPPSTDQWGHDGTTLIAFDQSGEDLPVGIGTTISQGAITDYFRYLFNFNPSVLGATLRFRHIINDGAIFYLNGTEFYRFNMPSGVVTETTPAAGVTSPVSISDTIEIPAGLLRAGSNVFAAELHGLSQVDSNWVFGVELQAQITSYATGRVVITSGPSDVTVEEGQPLNMTFSAIGASTFRWSTNGTLIPGATNATLSIPAVPLSWNGKLVSVTAANGGFTANSTNARVTVVADATPPTLVSAMLTGPSSVTVSFSEPITLAGTNIANYRITNSAGANLTISSGVLVNATNVVLNLPSIPPSSYTVIVNNIRDASSSSNLIASNSTVTVGFTGVSFPIDATWQYNSTGADLGTSWTALAYNDTAAGWSNGPALIADETAALPEPIKTPISRLDAQGAYHYTFYFRHHFTAPTGAKTGTITLRHIIDDGAVFYLNGAEFYRFNMPTGPVNYQTQGTTAIGDAGYSGILSLTVSNIVGGDNVIAVEVHQSGTASSDITFGAMASIDGASQAGSGSLSAPRLQISKQGTNVVVSWPGKGYTLERKTVLSPATYWAPVTNSPITISPASSTNQATFYRLRK